MRASIETRRFSPLGKIDDLEKLFIETNNSRFGLL